MLRESRVGWQDDSPLRAGALFTLLARPIMKESSSKETCGSAGLETPRDLEGTETLELKHCVSNKEDYSSQDEQEVVVGKKEGIKTGIRNSECP